MYIIQLYFYIMKKSKDITKYNIDWQIIRVQAKQEKNIINKLNLVYNWFLNNQSIDNRERIINQIEGLSKAYKDFQRLIIIEEIDKYFGLNKLPKENNYISSVEEIKKYSDKDLFILYKDLFGRNKKWLKNNYIEEEINEFMENIAFVLFESLEYTKRLESYYSELNNLKTNIILRGLKSTHKFLY